MTGLYYEEFEIGMEFKHSLTRTVTESDNLLFCALTHNPQPLHLDEEFSKGTEYGQRIVNSLFTLGLVIGVSVGDTTLGTTIGNLGMTDTRFSNPVFHGDTIRSVTKVREKRESKSRPKAGLVIFEHYGFNQRDEEIAFCVRTAFMMKKPA
ncbi:MAG: dehydratase [Rhodospirillaceae bacterium]|nr:dehydratase [Rhodospirillaceae bacterium]